MRHEGSLSIATITLALAALAAGCASDTSRTQGTAQATISLSQAVLPASSAAALFSITDGDSGPPGLIRRAWVDSLIVTVTAVEVLPDSLLARRHLGEAWGAREGGPGGMPGGPHGPGGMREGRGPFGPGGERDTLRLRDSTMLRDSLGWGHLSEDWYTLDVSGSGHLDLMHLPTDTGSGLVLAVGTVPAGTYGGARMIISAATLWLDTTLTIGGTTFVPGTGYAVTVPSGPQAGIRTRDGFTIAEGAIQVQLLFDPEQTVRALFVNPSGAIMLTPPMLGHHEHRD